MHINCSIIFEAQQPKQPKRNHTFSDAKHVSNRYISLYTHTPSAPHIRCQHRNCATLSKGLLYFQFGTSVRLYSSQPVLTCELILRLIRHLLPAAAPSQPPPLTNHPPAPTKAKPSAPRQGKANKLVFI